MKREDLKYLLYKIKSSMLIAEPQNDNQSPANLPSIIRQEGERRQKGYFRRKVESRPYYYSITVNVYTTACISKPILLDLCFCKYGKRKIKQTTFLQPGEIGCILFLYMTTLNNSLFIYFLLSTKMFRFSKSNNLIFKDIETNQLNGITNKIHILIVLVDSTNLMRFYHRKKKCIKQIHYIIQRT